MFRDYDSWKTTPPEPKVVAQCERCECDIDEGEYCHSVEDCIVCDECLVDYLKENFVGWSGHYWGE